LLNTAVAAAVQINNSC